MIRCPYCKAIIEESSEYCSNCGTQLLFPEDEFIEEEIPGERIVDEEPEEELEEESRQSKRREAEEEESPPEEESEEYVEFGEEGREEPETLEKTEEQSDETQREEHELTEEKERESPAVEEPSVEEALEKGKLEPPHMAPTDTEEYEGRAAAGGIAEEREERGETPIEQREEKNERMKAQKELAFKTDELERIVDTTEKEKEEIERFLDSLKRERAGKKIPRKEFPQPLPTSKDEREETEEDIPPWAAKMKDSPSEGIPTPEESQDFPFEMEERLSLEDEKSLDERTPAYDSGVGIPEGVGQRSIPFDEAAEEEKKAARIKGTSGLLSWLKSKAFDIFFVGAFWLIALWIASRVLEVSLFQLISASARIVIIFYGILLVSYYFLFLLFLGETLGDHLFSEER